MIYTQTCVNNGILYSSFQRPEGMSDELNNNQESSVVNCFRTSDYKNKSTYGVGSFGAVRTIATMPVRNAIGKADQATAIAAKSGSPEATGIDGVFGSPSNAPLFALAKCGMFIFPEDLNRGSNPLGVTFTSLFARVVRRFRSFTL